MISSQINIRMRNEIFKTYKGFHNHVNVIKQKEQMKFSLTQLYPNRGRIHFIIK